MGRNENERGFFLFETNLVIHFNNSVIKTPLIIQNFAEQTKNLS
jgi:hypothetical protein